MMKHNVFVNKKVQRFFDDIKEKYSDKNVLIVAHGGIAKVIKAYIYGFNIMCFTELF